MKAPRGAFMRSALMEFYSGTPTENLSGVDTPVEKSSVRGIAHLLGTSKSTAHRVLHELAAAGAVVLTASAAGTVLRLVA